VSTDQVLFGVGLILLLAVGSQVLASRLLIPALIILLPVGFVVGALTTDVNPQRLLGPAFQPLVSLAVGVILYDAGLALDLAKLRGNTRRVTTRLITVGVVLTWLVAAALAGLLFGLSVQAALMLGAILVVSGPTVVGPLLRFIRSTERLQRVLAWEGSLGCSQGKGKTRHELILKASGSFGPQAATGRDINGDILVGFADQVLTQWLYREPI
jgi:NhaP-type Na+/H+ or K+/H+ antiporter